MAHCIVPEAEKILDKKFRVLDKGFVRLVDYMGSDERIVQSARVSYGKGTKTYRQDRGLIHYLLKNQHTSPFEQVVMTFHVKLPIFVARQWVRHRTARINEISGRYSVMSDDFYLPAKKDIAGQSRNNKQGRDSKPVDAQQQKDVLALLEKDQKELYQHYKDLIDKNIARELARVNLPLSLYTEWYWQIDLNNLLRFLKLRLDPHAQKEIRVYAEVIHRLGSKVCPVAFEAFDEHMQSAVTFSNSEMQALRQLLQGKEVELGTRGYQQFTDKLGFDPNKSRPQKSRAGRKKS